MSVQILNLVIETLILTIGSLALEFLLKILVLWKILNFVLFYSYKDEIWVFESVCLITSLSGFIVNF